MSLPASATKDRVRSALSEVRAPTRSDVRAREYVSLGLGAVLVAGLALHRPDVLLAKPLAYSLVSVLTSGLYALGSLTLLGRFGASTLGPARSSLKRLARWVLPVLLLGQLAACLWSPATLTWPASGIWLHLHCPLLLWGCSALLACLATWALRGADPLQPRATSLAVGAMAGAWASLAVSLQCSFTDPVHVLAAHVLPVFVTVWLTAHLGARFIGIELGRRPG